MSDMRWDAREAVRGLSPAARGELAKGITARRDAMWREIAMDFIRAAATHGVTREEFVQTRAKLNSYNGAADALLDVLKEPS